MGFDSWKFLNLFEFERGSIVIWLYPNTIKSTVHTGEKGAEVQIIERHFDLTISPVIIYFVKILKIRWTFFIWKGNALKILILSYEWVLLIQYTIVPWQHIFNFSVGDFEFEEMSWWQKEISTTVSSQSKDAMVHHLVIPGNPLPMLNLSLWYTFLFVAIY